MRCNSGVAALLGRMNREIVVAIAGLGIVFCQYMPAGELKVDLGPLGRPNTGAPHFIEWKFDPFAPPKPFGEVSVMLRSSAGLEAAIYKFGIDYGARLACDGVFAKGKMKMVLSGLAPGSH